MTYFELAHMPTWRLRLQPGFVAAISGTWGAFRRRWRARARPMLATAAGRDLGIVVVVAALSVCAAMTFNLNEHLVGFALRHPIFDTVGLEEIPFGLAIVSLAAAWFASRRWHEYKAESTGHQTTMARLTQAMDAATAANKSKSIFLATMSHELRTPLNAILGFSEIIQSEIVGPAVSPRYRDYAGDIHSSGMLLLSIVNDILDMARFEVGTLRFAPDVVDIRETLERVRRLIAARAIEGGVQIEVSADRRLAGWADDEKLRQALLNLAFNAVKFTPRGGSVALRADRDGEFVRIAVSDTGVGIAPEDISKALTPFQQIENGMQRRREGTGLGLPLAKQYIEKQGGRFELKSALGAGTTVTVWIPSCPDQRRPWRAEYRTWLQPP